jgi:hypothetical protein
MYAQQRDAQARRESTTGLIKELVPQVFDFFESGGITGNKDTSIFGKRNTGFGTQNTATNEMERIRGLGLFGTD